MNITCTKLRDAGEIELAEQIVHVVLICFNNDQQTLLRWDHDVYPGVIMLDRPYKVTIVDNSVQKSALLEKKFGNRYLWQNGRNLYYGGALNLAVSCELNAQYLLYVCSCHGRSFDHSWICDILAPMESNPTIGQCGHLVGSNSPEGISQDLKVPWVKDKFGFIDDYGQSYVPQHVQGGVFAAKNDLMLRFPYPPELLHMYSDHWLTWSIIKAGFRCINVPSICSVWRNKIDNPERFKYVHDERE